MQCPKDSRRRPQPDIRYLMECSPSGYPVLEAPDVAGESPGVSRAGLRGWVVTDVPRYPGYKTPIVLFLVAMMVHEQRNV
jgi:hypothetical protein